MGNESNLWTWGDNRHGQLGDGTLTRSTTPVRVTGLPALFDVDTSSSSFHTLAVGKDGTVWSWGANENGQLGNGTTTSRAIAAEVSGVTIAAAVSAGLGHSLVRTSDGRLWGWGANSRGQLGDGSTIQRTNPISLALREPARFSAAREYSLVVKTDGTIWSTGDNQFGQLGDGTTLMRVAPVLLDGITAAVPMVVKRAVFTVAATGYPEPNYEWQRKPAGQSTFVSLINNGNCTGADTPVLIWRSLSWKMNGDEYRCVVSNPHGSSISSPAAFSITSVGSSATHTADVIEYTAGKIISITPTITYEGSAGALGWEVSLPAGWVYVGGSGGEGELRPQPGAMGTLGWSWITLPSSPVTFSFKVSVPVEATGPAQIVGTGHLWQNGFLTRLPSTPIVLKASELTRVFALYNARHGTIRTGAYKVDPTQEDGFAPDPTRGNGDTITLARYHSADGPPGNGKISLDELTRLIEASNRK